MLKGILLYLSRQKAIQSFMVKFGVTRRVVNRFVSGEELGDGLAAVKKVNSEGAIATLDHLGEEVSEAQKAISAADVYVNALDQIANDGVDTNVSAKPTQLGLKIDKALCQENFAKRPPLVLSHFEEPTLTRSTSLATDSVRDKEHRICTWSAVPPI